MYSYSSIVELFIETVERFPGKTAVVGNDGASYSFIEVNLASNRVAKELSDSGVSPGDRVGLCMNRSAEVIITMLAILKLGATYVPMSADFNSKRLALIYSAANLKVVVASASHIDRLGFVQTLVNVDDIDMFQSGCDDVKFVEYSNFKAPAYVMFTSGTTKDPKGVVVGHESFINLVKDQNYVSISSDDVFLQLSPIEFDGSTFEIWGALLNGATLVMMPAGYPMLSVLAEKITQYQVSILFITTQLFNIMVENRLSELDQVNQILFGGEVASLRHVDRFLSCRKNNTYLANIYGPTECTTFSTFFPIASSKQLDRNIPIGKPIKNVACFVINEEGGESDVGQEGELVIVGDGLALGYLRECAQNATGFGVYKLGDESSVRCYHTGDRVILNSDGDLLYLGRIDQQLKIRGYRVVPQEVEIIAHGYQGVLSAALLVKENDSHDKFLNLFVVVDGSGEFDGESFRIYLNQELPNYLQIYEINYIDKMPLKKNGKIDYVVLSREVEDV